MSIDTTSTEVRTRAYLEAIRNVTDRRVRTLINTHHHGDHTHRNWLLPQATILGHPRCREEILKSLFPPPSGIWSGVEWGELQPAPPFVTFERPSTVWLDELRVELYPVPTPAHTTKNVVVWIPERAVLFSGDLVFVGGTPFVPMGSVSGSLAALDWLKQIGAQKLRARSRARLRTRGAGPHCRLHASISSRKPPNVARQQGSSRWNWHA